MAILKTICAIAAVVMIGCGGKSDSNVEVVPPRQYQSMLDNDPNAYLVDARKPDEYAAGHLKGAHLINWLDTDTYKQSFEDFDKSKTIYIYCRSGRRSNEAAVWLAGNGYRVVDLKGGILEWNAEGMPTE